MYFATLFFSLIVTFNGLALLNGAKLQIESRSGSNWVLGESGSKCNSVCAKVGGTCNSAEQSKLTSKALMEDAMLKATGKPCKVVDFRGYPGSPFYRPGAKDCFYLTNGATSVCDGNSYGGHSPLCYCDFPTTTTTTEAPTTPAAEKTGDCEDKNELCQMEPAFLLDILCQIDTVKEQCPKRCNSCPEPVVTTEAPTTTTTAMPKCERKYNGYYSYGDCGSQNGVKSFEECCELTKQRNATSSRNIIRFSWNGNSCAFKCGGKQDNRGGSWWSSAEDISTCTCQ